MLQFAAICAFLFFSACGSNEKKESPEKDKPAVVKEEPAAIGPVSKLEGSWIIKRAEGEMADYNVGTVYEFQGSKLSFGKDGYKNPGKSDITDSTFSFQADGNELKFMYNYKFKGDTLIIEMQKGSGQVFYLVKQ